MDMSELNPELLCTDRFRSADFKELTVELTRSDETNPRYTIIVTDKQKIKDKAAMTFAALIVPQGRNCEWLFGVAQGRINLVESSGFDRLAIIHLHRYQEYDTLEDVEQEIYGTLVKLAPAVLKVHLRRKKKIPFLSVGEDLGRCRQIARGESEMSGEYVIEETEGKNKELFRRLIFTATPNCIQSESKLLKVKTKGTSKNVIDYSYLACEHHKYMALAVTMVDKIKEPLNILIIGLGGGALSMYLHMCFKQANITTVEIDSEILQIAKKYFGLKENEKLTVAIADGIDYLHSASNKDDKYQAILFDVDSKDSSLGVSCPPMSFLQYDLLATVAECLDDTGIFILNLATRMDDIRVQTWDIVRMLFKHVTSIKTEQDLNELLFCWKTEPTMSYDKAAIQLNSNVKINKLRTDDIINVSKLLSMVCHK